MTADPETSKGLVEAAKEIVKPAYDDAVKPAAQQVGQALGTVAGVINIALTPVALMVHGMGVIQEKLKKGLEDKLENVKPEDIIEPPLNIVGPIIEKYKYSHENDSLSDMFLNLLANSMDKNTVRNAHPSFADIIAQLTPDEARLFRSLANHTPYPKVDVHIETAGSRGSSLVYSNYIVLPGDLKLEHSDLIPTYFDNLKRLSLIDFTSGANQDYLVAENAYKETLESEILENTRKNIEREEGKTMKTIKGFIWVTDYGKTFYSATNRD